MINFTNVTSDISTTVSVHQNTSLLVAAIVVSVIIVLFSGISGWIIRKRVYYASVSGKVEHRSGRLIGLALIATFFIEFLKLGWTIYAIIVSFSVWIVYLLSHTIEKTLYGNHGPRG